MQRREATEQTRTAQNTAPSTQPGTRPCTTVYYDGSCPLCTAEIHYYAAKPGADQLAFVDVSRPDSNPGPGLSPDAAMRRFHVRTPDGDLYSGAQAFVLIWKHFPGWRLAARAARLPGVSALLEGGYRLFLPIRPWVSEAAGRLGFQPENPRDQKK